MKWIKTNNVELVLGVSSTLFLINMFSSQDKEVYTLVIPFVVLGVIMLYKRHRLIIKPKPTVEFQCARENNLFAKVYDDGEDDLYEEAKEAVLKAGKASTSFLQRKLRIGYSRSARLIDILEERGVIGSSDGSRPREISKK